MTPKEQKQVAEEFSWATSKLATTIIPTIKNTYAGIELIDLLMSLPIKFEFKEIDYNILPSNVDPKGTVFGGYITRDTERGNPDRLVVHMVLTKNKDETWEKFFKRIFDSSDRTYFVSMAATTYLHEALHILMRHYDYYQTRGYFQLMESIRSDLDDEMKSQIQNYAFDYWINAYLIEQAAPVSFMSTFVNNPDNFPYLYDPNMGPGKMEQQEILVKLTKEAKIKKTPLQDSDGNRWGEIVEVDINGRTTTSITIDGQHQIEQQGQNETTQEQEISKVLDGARREILERTRGTEGQKTLQELGVDYSVPLDWFKYLKASLFNVVQKYTSKYDQTWSKLKNKFRHIAPMPGRVYYEKNFAAVVSIDQSGSMSNEDLEKINYVVYELAKKASFVEVILHDHHVAEQRRFTSKSPLQIKDFITTRIACGGTSHREVFEALDEIKKKYPKHKFIYISFSDNWSDIEEVYSEDIFRGITSYWVTVDESKIVDVPGMQISLEHGLLQF